ncbi:peptidoglycan-binding protein [Kitasatospora sp. NPDC005856]|uniref:peptidoglycan-binding protein n=1 Tax=Kitasatospora sp. NPDC005856 TaxID=3154566 RepID=UPI0033D97B85
MRRRTLIASLVVVVAAVGGTAAVTRLGPAAGHGNAAAAEPTARAGATAEVTRSDLSSSVRRNGTLGFAAERKVNATTTGTLTWTPAPGTGVERDQRLYEADGRAVWLLYGAEPMYRTLRSGDEGKDVRQLEENLRALGLAGSLTVDGKFTDATAEAVRRWQKSHGLEQTGQVGPDQVAFLDGAVRVQENSLPKGDPLAPGKPVLTVTGSERVARFPLAVGESDLARAGSAVQVTLPDGTKAAGKVTEVGRTAKTGEDAQDKTPRIDVTVTFDDPGKVGGLDQAPVTVDLVKDTRKGVLSVPVNALLALPDGGFAVEVVDQDGTSHEATVRLGMFGQGRVEVTGEGLATGAKVRVPGK